MKINTITYEKLRNDGHYCHSKLSASASLDDNENSIAAMDKLRAVVLDGLTPSRWRFYTCYSWDSIKRMIQERRLRGACWLDDYAVAWRWDKDPTAAVVIRFRDGEFGLCRLQDTSWFYPQDVHGNLLDIFCGDNEAERTDFKNWLSSLPNDKSILGASNEPEAFEECWCEQCTGESKPEKISDKME